MKLRIIENIKNTSNSLVNTCIYITNAIAPLYAKEYCGGKYQPSGNKKSVEVRTLLEGVFEKVVMISAAFVKGKALRYIPARHDDGIEHVPSILGNVLSPFITAYYLFALIRKEQKAGNSVSLCIYNYYPFTHFPARIASFLCNVRVIQEVEDLTGYTRTVNPLLRWYAAYFERKRKRAGGAFIVTSSYMKEYLNMSGEAFLFYGFWTYDRKIDLCEVVNAGADVGHPRRMLFSGSIDEKRNVLQFLSELSEHDPGFFKSWKVIVTGRCCGDVRPPKDGELPKNVEYRGFVSDDEQRSLSSQVDAFLNYQKVDDYYYCSFPSKVMDYLKYGKVVFTPYHNDLMRLKESGANIHFYTGVNDFGSSVGACAEFQSAKMSVAVSDRQVSTFREYLSECGVV